MSFVKKGIFFFIILILTAAAKVSISLPKTSGKVSWYGSKFAGKLTANGEKFNPRDHTCASRIYPMNTWLHLYYPKTNRSVTVRVNDRGPWIKGRILDISESAADILGLKKAGVDFMIITPLNSYIKMKQNEKD